MDVECEACEPIDLEQSCFFVGKMRYATMIKMRGALAGGGVYLNAMPLTRSTIL